MAKKRSKETVDTSASGELRQSPFADLLGGEAPADEAPAPPEPPSGDAEAFRFGSKVVVRRETKGRGGKTVTRVSGLPAEHLEDLAKRMKKALGCGAKVEAPDLLLLGDLVDRAAAWLEAEGAPRVVRGN